MNEEKIILSGEEVANEILRILAENGKELRIEHQIKVQDIQKSDKIEIVELPIEQKSEAKPAYVGNDELQ